MSIYFVIFGAAVRPDGTPGGTLLRRVEGALSIARGVTDRVFIATGGIGRHGPAEAHVIRDVLLARGVPASRILIEDAASDTLESVQLCDRLLRERDDVDDIVLCSSGYHIPRCALLFRLLGHRVRIGRMRSDLPHLGWRRWLTYVLKECIALPYDAMLLLVRTGLRPRAS